MKGLYLRFASIATHVKPLGAGCDSAKFQGDFRALLLLFLVYDEPRQEARNFCPWIDTFGPFHGTAHRSSDASAPMPRLPARGSQEVV